jgi:hypothetical protein
VIAAYCVALGDANSVNSCFHGVGHGLYGGSGSWKSKRSTCLRFVAHGGGTACISGMYMERVISTEGDESLGTSSKGSSLAANMEPCQQLDATPERAYCTRYAIVHADQSTPVTNPAELCAKVTSERWDRIGCAMGYAGYRVEDLPTCANHEPDEARYACAFSTVSSAPTTPDSANLERQCEKLDMVDACFAGVGARFWTSGDIESVKSQRFAECSGAVPARFADACLGGALHCWPRLFVDTPAAKCDELLRASVLGRR